MNAKALRVLRIALCAAVVFFVLIRVGGCVLRWTTAEFEGTKLKIAGVTYVHHEFSSYTGTKRAIAYVGGWTVHPIEEDPSRTFLRVNSSLDGYGYVREDYVIPTDGEITVVYIDRTHRYTNRQLCEIIADLRKNPPPETFVIRTDAIYRYAVSVTVGYEDCPIATDFIGYLGHINGSWVFIPPVELEYDNGYAETDFVCHVLPEEYTQYFEGTPYMEAIPIETVSVTE